MYRQPKKLLNINISSIRPHNMVNFGPLTAEIGSTVWGTPANFNWLDLCNGIVKEGCIPEDCK